MRETVRPGAASSVVGLLAATSTTPGAPSSGEITSFAGVVFTGSEASLQHDSGLNVGSHPGGQQDIGASSTIASGPASITIATVMETAFDTLST